MKKVLDFIKANVFALMCAVVALVAIVAYFFWPIPAKFEEFRGEVSARANTYKTISDLNTKPRTLPNLDPSAPATAPLSAFPTRTVIAEGTKAVQQIKDGAQRLLDRAVALNARPLLVEGVLPNPTSFTRGQFLDAYRRATAQYGENVDQGIVRRLLKGTLPPTPEEMAAADAQMVNEVRKAILQTDARGVPQNQAAVDAEIARRRAELPLQQRVGRAQNFAIYVNPGAVEIHPAMGDTVSSSLTNISIFNAQFSFWVQSIVLEAIADANKGSKSVLTSPVKHLLSLRVPMNIADPASNPAVASFGAPDPNAGPPPAVELKPDPTAPITPKYETDPLGYVSNSMYDPIRVRMALRIEAARLSEAIAALSQNHLIKIRNVNFRTVSVGTALSEGFIYSKSGDVPIVEADIDCDVLMLRSWVVPFMPDPVKAVFQAMANPAPPAG